MQKYFLLLAATATFMACDSNKKGSTEDSVSTDSLEQSVDQRVRNANDSANATADTVGTWFREQRDKAAHDLEERRKEVDAKIEELKKDANQKNDKARKRLEEVRDDIDKSIDNVKNSTAEAWDDTKKGVDKTMKKADDEWQEFKRDFKELFR